MLFEMAITTENKVILIPLELNPVRYIAYEDGLIGDDFIFEASDKDEAIIKAKERMGYYKKEEGKEIKK